jgi:hypothetical protein
MTAKPAYAPGWGSPSWSGNGPPPAPPPISMTPPPVSWGQAPVQQAVRRPPVMPQVLKKYSLIAMLWLRNKLMKIKFITK